MDFPWLSFFYLLTQSRTIAELIHGNRLVFLYIKCYNKTKSAKDHTICDGHKSEITFRRDSYGTETNSEDWRAYKRR